MTQFDLEGLGDRLAAARKANGLSAQALADACGPTVTRAVIANVESGRRATLELGQLLDLAWALQVPPMALVFPLDDVNAVVGTEGERLIRLSEALPWAQGPSRSEELSRAGADAVTRIELILRYLSDRADMIAADELLEAAKRASPVEEAWAEYDREARRARSQFAAIRAVLRGMDVVF